MSKVKLPRRAFLQIVAGGVASTVVCGTFSFAGTGNLPRPPGALEENEFLARCSRCMRCLDVCQPLAINPAHWTDGPRNLGTPILDTPKCIRCMECIRICPTGALSKIPKSEVIIGSVTIVKEVCLAWLGKRRCDICFKSCSMKAITMKDRRYPELDQEKCDACGVCIRRCPEQGSLVISPEGAKRYPPQPGRLLLSLEDRVGPYEVAPPAYGEWFINRLRSLAQRYGL